MTDKPHGVEILGQKMVLYRESSGKVRNHALECSTILLVIIGGIYCMLPLHFSCLTIAVAE